MRIATMVRAYLSVPKPKDIVYAPIDLAVDIAAGLRRRGHSINFYAPMGSTPPGTLHSLHLPTFIKNDKEFQRMLGDKWLMSHALPTMYDQYYARQMFEDARAGKYDILHFHHPEVALPFARLYPDVPVVYTLHDPVFEWYNSMFKLHYSKNQYFISLSDAQRNYAPKLRYVSTVYNGVDTAKFKFSHEHDDYLFYVGRIIPDKGVAEAIQLALKTKQRFLFAGPVFPDNENYFKEKIEPYLSDTIQYFGYMDHDKLPRYMQRAKALLMPVKWDEPFGITMAEALASGTPVIGSNRGSIPELIEDGVTGYIANNTAEFVRAIKNIDKIERSNCRLRAEKFFTTEHMVNGYEKAFEKIISKHNKMKSLG